MPFAALRERLRLLAATPADASTFASLVVIAVAAAAAITALLILPPDKSAPDKPPARATARPQAPPAPSPPTLTKADLDDAKSAARRFLPGYLAYSYGRRRPIHDASPELTDDLASKPLPRVPPRVRSRQPRVYRGLTTEGSNPQRVILGAFVEDGSVSYTIQLSLEPTPTGSWLVTGVTR